MDARAPLLAAFEELRRRGHPLGISEYLAALRALAAGFGTGSRAELVFLCETLWAKSLDDQLRVRDALTAVLPESWTDQDLRDIERRNVIHDQATTPPPDAAAAPPPDAAAAGAGTTLDPLSRASASDAPRSLALPPLPPARRARDVESRFDLELRLPLTPRQMNRAWRFYRRMGRRGVPVDFDAEGTIRQLYRHGVLVEPVLMPRRTNQARALILEDTGGSMAPFRYMTRALIDAARHAGLARVDVRYFHDVAGAIVYRDATRLEPLPLDDATSFFVDSGMLICSDAGAARGRLDRPRVERTARLIERLRQVTPAIAWINPVPPERWRGTTAAAIQQRTDIPMFPLDRTGVQQAVDIMRGRAE